MTGATRRRLNRIESLLIERGVISYEVLEAAKDRQRGAKRPLVEVLVEQDAVDEDLLVEVLADATGMEVVPGDLLDPDPAVQELIGAERAQMLGVLPLRIEDDTLVVATADPLQVLAFDELAKRTDLHVRPVLARPSDVRNAMRRARDGEEELCDVVKNAVHADVELSTLAPREGGPGALDISEGGDDGPTIQLVNLILSDAITRKASDIHIECEKEALRVRFRHDGELQDILALPRSTAASVLSRIKIIAGLDIIETRRPQDGRCKVTCQRRTYDLRVSTLPSYFGEKAVLRILDPSAASFSLDRSGLEPDVLAKWRELIHRPNGLLLMTGPTGSGKTSTLYASLLEVRDPKLNIVAVEDPVEYQFPGIVHVPVRADIGMTFAAALRSILRQDPDVVLVGEIRDAETAQIAVRAAMTGHLVLSTLHTNDAYGALPRLLDLGIDPAQLSSCLLGVMAQRLARTLCADCAVECEYDECELARLGWAGEPGTFRQSGGCRECRGSGRRGRSAIAELVVMTPELAHLLNQDAGEAAIRDQIATDGTRPLVASGLRKVVAGLCTPDEILKVAAREVEGQAVANAAAAAAAAVVAAPAKPTEQECDCPSCGATGPAEWRYCPSCGEKMPEEAAGPYVLVCDDERVARRMAIASLRKEFRSVREAGSGEEALDVIAREKPDLLVVDMMMPGMSGVDVIKALRSDLTTSTIPIIMLTASDDESLESASLEAGADDYLRKPVVPERLRARARALLRARARLVGSA